MNGRTLLIVDDDAGFRDAQRHLFCQAALTGGLCAELFEVGSGKDALRLLGSRKVDCVLLDHDMPGGSGLEWLGRILEANPGVAVIMLTAEGREDLADEALKAGAVDYLVKGSITVEELRRVVSHAVARTAPR